MEAGHLQLAVPRRAQSLLLESVVGLFPHHVAHQVAIVGVEGHAREPLVYVTAASAGGWGNRGDAVLSYCAPLATLLR